MAAATNLLISLRFVMLVRRRTGKITASVSKLASGQRQDAWAASGTIWGVILCKRLPDIEVLYAIGLIFLIWLTYRTIVRTHLLLKEKPADGG